VLLGASVPHPTKWSPMIIWPISTSPLPLSGPHRLVITLVAPMASNLVPHASSAATNAALFLPELCVTILRSPPGWLTSVTLAGLRAYVQFNAYYVHMCSTSWRIAIVRAEPLT
jgi:hypothetical protein